MRKLRVLAAATATAVTLGLVGMTSPASADIGDDIAKLAENGPAALDALTTGLQDTLDVLTGTQSAVATSAALGDTLVAAGGALVAGTEQFGALSLAFIVVNGGVQDVLNPFLTAIDDPSTAGDAVDPEDVNTLLENLGPAVDHVLHGTGDSGVVDAAAAALRGDLFDGLSGGAIYFAIEGVVGGTNTLINGTSFTGLGLPLAVAGLAVILAGGDYLQQLQDAVGPLLEGLAPVAEPVASILDGI